MKSRHFFQPITYDKVAAQKCSWKFCQKGVIKIGWIWISRQFFSTNHSQDISWLFCSNQRENQSFNLLIKAKLLPIESVTDQDMFFEQGNRLVWYKVAAQKCSWKFCQKRVIKIILESFEKDAQSKKKGYNRKQAPGPTNFGPNNKLWKKVPRLFKSTTVCWWLDDFFDAFFMGCGSLFIIMMSVHPPRPHTTCYWACFSS